MQYMAIQCSENYLIYLLNIKFQKGNHRTYNGEIGPLPALQWLLSHHNLVVIESSAASSDLRNASTNTEDNYFYKWLQMQTDAFSCSFAASGRTERCKYWQYPSAKYTETSFIAVIFAQSYKQLLPTRAKHNWMLLLMEKLSGKFWLIFGWSTRAVFAVIVVSLCPSYDEGPASFQFPLVDSHVWCGPRYYVLSSMGKCIKYDGDLGEFGIVTHFVTQFRSQHMKCAFNSDRYMFTS